MKLKTQKPLFAVDTSLSSLEQKTTQVILKDIYDTQFWNKNKTTVNEY